MFAIASSSLLSSSRRRVQIDLVVLILQCIASMHHLKEEKENRVNASSLNLICQSCRMIHPQARRYISLMCDAGLIRRQKKKKIVRSKHHHHHHSYSKPKREAKVYSVSEKGAKFIDLHRKLIELLPPEMVPSFELLLLS
jgi:predicted transcriptional regulator